MKTNSPSPKVCQHSFASRFQYLFIALFFALLLFQSCAKHIADSIRRNTDLEVTRKYVHQYDADHPLPDFQGMKSYLKENETLNILLIHGVGRIQPSHFNSLEGRIVDQLLPHQGNMKIKSDTRKITCDQPGDMAGTGEIKIKIYQCPDGRELRIFNVHWAPITRKLKDQIKALDENPLRTALPDSMKSKTFMEVFGDMALYLSPYGECIRDGIGDAFDLMQKDEFGQYFPKSKSLSTILVTGSFGSQMVIDVLSERTATLLELEKIFKKIEGEMMPLVNRAEKTIPRDRLIHYATLEIEFLKTKEINWNDHKIDHQFLDSTLNVFVLAISQYPTPQITVDICSREMHECKNLYPNKELLNGTLKKIFMLSNQLPFSSLMDISPHLVKNKKDYTRHVYKNLDSLLSVSMHPLELVSFYDVNDVFGYQLPKPIEANYLKVINIRTSNTLEWSFNPQRVYDQYIEKIKSSEIRKSVEPLLERQYSKQSFNISIATPNEKAKENLAIIGYMIAGSQYEPGWDEMKIVESTGMKPERKTVARTKAGFQRKKWKLKDFFTGIVEKRIARKIKKMEIRATPMEYNQFAKDAFDLQGIARSIEENDYTNVMTIHGMTFKSPDHFDALIEGLLKELNFYPQDVNRRLMSVGLDEASLAGTTTLRISEYQNGDGKTLRFIVVYWSPLTQPTKNLLNEVDVSLEENDISFAPKYVKKFIVNDGFSDVALTLSKMKPNIQAILDEAFSVFVLDYPFESNPLSLLDNHEHQDAKKVKNHFIISSSLGSRIMFDYISDRLKLVQQNPNDERGKRVHYSMKHLNQFFMLSNQLPITSLKDIPTELNSKDFADHIYGNWNSLKNYDLDLVVFNDPNDIMGFRLPKHPGSKLRVHNISLNNAEGISFNVHYAYKFSKYLDKIFRKLKNTDERFNKRIRQTRRATNGGFNEYYLAELKKDKELFDHFFSIPLKTILDKNTTNQRIVYRFDLAHSGVVTDGRVIKAIANGMKDLPQTSESELPVPEVKTNDNPAVSQVGERN